MAAQDVSVWSGVLGITAPWQVVGTVVSAESHHLVVQIEHDQVRGGFFGRRAAPPVRRQIRWDHLPVAGWRCVIQIGLREGEHVPNLPWAGEEPEGYTRALGRTVLDLMLAGATLDQLCVLLHLPIGSLWRFKYRMDQGLARPGAAAAAATAQSTRDAAAARAAMAADPLGDHAPVWADLLLGRASLDVRMLGLKLLLSKLQREAKLHRDADLHRQAAQEIHRYFTRNRSALGHEWRQIEELVRRTAVAPAMAAQPAQLQLPAHAVSAVPDEDVDAARPATAVPEASDPLWLGLLQGEHVLDVRTLGLRLLLTKLRGQIRVIDDDEVRMVKLVELHRYFERHQALLGHEIAQLQRWTRH